MIKKICRLARVNPRLSGGSKALATVFLGFTFLLDGCGTYNVHKVKVEGEVGVKISVGRIRSEINTHCDKIIDNKPVYPTVEEYKKCVDNLLNRMESDEASTSE